MAAEMVSSAIAQEAVSQALSRFKARYANSDAKEHMERMEMAQIKLEAVLETSNRWNVTSAPLLRWRSKLKRVAQECDSTLRRCRQRLQDEEEMEKDVRSSSFPKRVAHTVKSFVSSIFSHSDADELTGSTAVRRFERFADGASEFLRYVELGGTPCRYMFFDPLIRHLLGGKGTKYCFVRGGQHLSFILQPFSSPNHGMEGSLIFLLEDANAPENNFLLALNLQLSESIDIVGVVIRCLQLFMPHLSSTAETVKTKLTQVPTQDLCWVSDAYSVFGFDDVHHINIHTICTKWFRPNPFCCQQQDHCNDQSSTSKSSSCDVYLRPVIQVYLLGHTALSVGNNSQRAVVNDERQTSTTRDIRYLKLGAHFWPHASSEDVSPAVGGSASNISIEQLGEIMIPKAVDSLCRNATATTYQTLWKSKHGGAYLRLEKTSSCSSTATWKGRAGKRSLQRRGKKVPAQDWTSANNEFICSWIAHAPAQVRAQLWTIGFRMKGTRQHRYY